MGDRGNRGDKGSKKDKEKSKKQMTKKQDQKIKKSQEKQLKRKVYGIPPCQSTLPQPSAWCLVLSAWEPSAVVFGLSTP